MDLVVTSDTGPVGDVYRLASELQDFVKTRLSAHEYPREIAFIDHLPMTTTGKIIRRLLREKA